MSARDGLSALIGRTAPPVRLGRFHLVSDGARGCRTVRHPTGPCDTSSVGGTARGTSARDGLSALIGRTAPPVRLGRFHFVSDGACGCRTVHSSPKDPAP